VTRSRAALAASRRARTSDNGYTVDELAVRSGVPSRTIRFYQGQGILPAPVRRGRIALYAEEHVDRLRLVALLQGRGLRLSAIGDLMRRGRPESLSLNDWLGLDERVRTPWTEDEPRVVSDTELRTLLEAHPDVSVDTLYRAGLARPAGDGSAGHILASPALLDITLQFDTAGIDVDTALAAGRLMRDHLAALATQLVAHFVERIGGGFGREATPAELARAFDVLRPLGVEAARIVFAREVQRALRDLLAASPVGRPSPRQRREVRRAGRRVRRRPDQT
jgi:DNA-binding transcriptional MerR regulator